MNQRKSGRRQQDLFHPRSPVQLNPELRQAVLPALAALIAAALRRPAAPPPKGGPHEDA